MLRYILLMNRKLLKLIQPSLFVVGCAFMCIFGAMIMSSTNTIEIDTSKFPIWLGYVIFYGGMLAISMVGIDFAYRLVFSLKRRFNKNINNLPSRFKLRFKNRSNDNSLLARIRECEKS